MPEIKKSLEDTINFHNSSLNKKINYLDKKLHSEEEKIRRYKNSLDQNLDLEKEKILLLSNESELAGFFMIEKEIQDKSEEKGGFKFILDEIKTENNIINALNSEIENLRKDNEKNKKNLEKNLKIFNKYFREITKKLFKDVELSLTTSLDSSTNEILYSIVNIDQISGDGSPRAASMAFDMALIAYTKEIKSHRPTFTIQDYLESMDEDKLATLSKFANEHKIQVVASVLKHTLQSLSDDFIQKNTVLWLSKSDKFFKLP